MKDFIEKLIGRLEEQIFSAELHDYGWEGQTVHNLLVLGDVKDIANQLAEEYADNEVLSMVQMNNAFQKAKLEELKQIRADVMADRWIPCIERLPDKFGAYLVSRKGCLRPEIELYNKKFEEWTRDDVIAWQPLPEPFKPEGE